MNRSTPGMQDSRQERGLCKDRHSALFTNSIGKSMGYKQCAHLLRSAGFGHKELLLMAAELSGSNTHRNKHRNTYRNTQELLWYKHRNTYRNTQELLV